MNDFFNIEVLEEKVYCLIDHLGWIIKYNVSFELIFSQKDKKESCFFFDDLGVELTWEDVNVFRTMNGEGKKAMSFRTRDNDVEICVLLNPILKISTNKVYVISIVKI